MTAIKTTLFFWISSIAHLVRTEQFLANLTRITAQEYACEYASQLSFKVAIPSSTSSSLFNKTLTLSLALPQGTSFINTNIQVFWNDTKVPLLSLGDSEFPFIQAKIQLTSGNFEYSLTFIHSNSIIHPFSGGEKPITLNIFPIDMSNQILGQTSMTLDFRPGKLR